MIPVSYTHLHNNAPYCVSIALRSKEELLVGVVYEVCRYELYWTYKGAPSYPVSYTHLQSLRPKATPAG